MVVSRNRQEENIMKKAIAMLLATVMCTAMLTGCGSDSAANKSTQASESSVAETAAATTEAAATEAASTEGGVLVFGTNAEFPPFEYVGDDGEPDGFDVALIKAVGEKLGKEVQVENMEFDSLVSSIGNRIDGAIAGMTVTEERKAEVDFSDPYYEAVLADILRYQCIEGTVSLQICQCLIYLLYQLASLRKCDSVLFGLKTEVCL